MKRLTICLAMAATLCLGAPSFAAGSDDHQHPVKESAPASDAHENSDGHHDDAPIDEMIESHESADGHHDGAVADPHLETNEEMAHDHSAHESGTWATNEVERLFAWLGKFHPAATNFPIALLLAALLAEMMFAITGNASIRNAARFCLWTGGLAAAITAVLGWGFVGFNFAEDDAVLSAHRWNGTALAGVSLLALWLGERAFRGRGTGAFRAVLVLIAVMASYNGYLGGKMVYGQDHYEWPTN